LTGTVACLIISLLTLDELMDHQEEDVEGLALYEDIVNEVLAGRTEGHKCPACGQGELECSLDGERVLIRCPECGRFLDGMLA